MFKTEVTMKNPPPNPNFTQLAAAIVTCLKAVGIDVEVATIKNFSLKLQGNWEPGHKWTGPCEGGARGSRSMICKLMLDQVPACVHIAPDEYVNIYGIPSHVDYNAKLHIPVRDKEYAMIMEACKPPVTTSIPVIDAELNGVRAGEQTVIAAPGKPYTPTQVVDMLRSILQKWTASQVEEFRTLVPDVMPLYSKARLQEAANEQGRNTGLVQAYQLNSSNMSNYPKWPAWVTTAIATLGWSGKVVIDLSFNTISGKEYPETDGWVVCDSLGNITVHSNQQFCKVYTPASCSQLDNYYSRQTVPTTKVEESIPLHGFQLTADAVKKYPDWPAWVKAVMVALTESASGKPLLKIVDGKRALTVRAYQWLVQYSDGSLMVLSPESFAEIVGKLPPEPPMFDKAPVETDTRQEVEAFHLTKASLKTRSTWPKWLTDSIVLYSHTGIDTVTMVVRTAAGERYVYINEWLVLDPSSNAVKICSQTHFDTYFKLKPATQPQLVTVDAVQMTREFTRDWLSWPAWLKNSTLNLDDSGDILLHPPVGENQTASFDDWVIHCEDGSLDVCRPGIFGKFYRVKPPTTEATK